MSAATAPEPRGSALRFGLIGYGAWGRHHAQAIAREPGARLTAIACRTGWGSVSVVAAVAISANSGAKPSCRAAAVRTAWDNAAAAGRMRSPAGRTYWPLLPPGSGQGRPGGCALGLSLR